MTLTIMANVDNNLVLSADRKLAYRIPADLKNFKSYTSNKTCLAGTNTYAECKDLPNRQWVKLSRGTAEDTLILGADNESEFVVVGGAKIFELALPIADKMFLSRPHNTRDFAESSCTYFPSNFEFYFRRISTKRMLGFDLETWVKLL